MKKISLFKFSLCLNKLTAGPTLAWGRKAEVGGVCSYSGALAKRTVYCPHPRHHAYLQNINSPNRNKA